MSVKLIATPPQHERAAGPEMPAQYRGDGGQERWALERYQAGECDGVCALAISQARLRLARGDDADEVQEWLTQEIAQAAEDEAARARWGRKSSLTLSENPQQTRSGCAAALARAVVREFNNRRR